MKPVLPLLLTAASIALTGCSPSPQPVPLSQLDAQQSHGHAIYQARCAQCHYDRQTGPLHGPSLSGIFQRPALPSGAAATDERVVATILHGRNQMPAMGNQVDPDEMRDLLAYLHTL